jgi:hypothetical protein
MQSVAKISQSPSSAYRRQWPMCRWIPSSRVVAALLSPAGKRLILRLGQGKSDSHDRRTLSPARPLGRLHGAGRGRPRGGLRAVCARPCAVEHARRHPRDGALAVAHRAARHSQRLARGKGTHRRRSLPRGILGGSPRRRRVRAHTLPRSSAAPMAGHRRAASTMPAACCGGSCSSAAAASTRSPITASERRNTSCRG